MPQCCYLAKGAKRPRHTTIRIKFDRIPFDPCNSIKRFELCPSDQKNSTYLQPPMFTYPLRLNCRSEAKRSDVHIAMPQSCYLDKGAKRPSHTTNTNKFDCIPFDPCNSIKRFDLCPFDQKKSTYLQPPLKIHINNNNKPVQKSYSTFLFSKSLLFLVENSLVFSDSSNSGFQ